MYNMITMKKGKSRLNIGCVTDGIIYEYQVKAWEAIISSAQEKDVNLFTFVGGRLRSGQGFDVYANQVYNLVTPRSIDGLIVLSSAIGGEVTTEEIGNFCRKYLPLPVVNISLAIEGIPSILIDNRSEVKKALSHLIEDHNCRNIAFIQGTVYNQESQERYQAYLETLAEYHIPVNESLIFIGGFLIGGFLRVGGREAVKVLL
ncbi:MAG TPA: hypothetical protein PK016_06210, partial [Candidatus Atribacteria bacterium]|nr:hypothetical protein [Candidatus Atribacteria bacterium]